MIPTFDPLFGDMASDPQDPMSPIHRGSVIQLMNREGNVIVLNVQSPPSFGDTDLYRNYLGVIAAGLGPQDVVLAPCSAMPGMSLSHDR
jgi:hypothetical protein